ncbi:MAG: hypothetical protein ACFE7E_05835 [Candidatus Hodarchaeota archaeon]
MVGRSKPTQSRKLTEKDILIATLLKKNPQASIRKLSSLSKFSKDTIFRSINKMNLTMDMKRKALINYPAIGLKPTFVFAMSEIDKLDIAFESLKMPYLNHIFTLMGGETFAFLAFYTLPNPAVLRSILGTYRSWRWHTNQHIMECSSVGSDISFQYYSVKAGTWNVTWPLWGLFLKEILLKKGFARVQKFDQHMYRCPDGSQKIDVMELEILEELWKNLQMDVSKLVRSHKTSYATIRKKRQILSKRNAYWPHLAIDPMRSSLFDRIILIADLKEEDLLDGIQIALQALPYSITYRVSGDLNGMIAVLSLPSPGVSRIFHILSEHLWDMVDNYWIFPVINHLEVNNPFPLGLFGVQNQEWFFPPKIQNRKYVPYKKQTEEYELPDLVKGSFA